MKKLILLVILLIACGILYAKLDALVGYFSMSKKKVASSSHLLHKEAVKKKNLLIAYFSWGGNTKEMATFIHERIGGDLFEITPRDSDHYPKEYKPTVEVGAREVKEKIYPPCAELPDLSSYDTILIGYPIWWHEAPMIVQGFLRSYNLSGKTILPFATSGGDDVALTVPSIEASAKGARIGKALTANIKRRIVPWLKMHELY